MPFIIGVKDSQADKDNNMVAHQHIIFSKKSKDFNPNDPSTWSNVGFHGDEKSPLFDDSKNINQYTLMDCSYDAKTLRKVIKNVGNPGKYSFWLKDNNCQDYVERVINEYNKIK